MHIIIDLRQTSLWIEIHLNLSTAAQPSISVTTEVVRSPGLLSAPVGGDVVIFDVGQGRYFSLEDVGASIWQRLEQPVTVTALCDALALEYDASRQTIEDDVVALLTDMANNRLIRV